jgi:hypothetical protein
VNDWTQMSMLEFDAQAKPVQEALFAAADPVGTMDLFDSQEG